MLLSTVSGNCSSGGQILSCHPWAGVYVALVHKQPMSVNLSTYDQASAFDLEDDGAYSNMVVLLVARILQLLHPSAHSTNISAWETLETEVDAWNDAKPDTFQPVFYEAADLSQDRAFPTICMLSSAPSMWIRLLNSSRTLLLTRCIVAGLLYYHVARILLKMHKPISSMLSGFDAAKQRYEAEVCSMIRVQIRYNRLIIDLETEKRCTSSRSSNWLISI